MAEDYVNEKTFLTESSIIRQKVIINVSFSEGGGLLKPAGLQKTNCATGTLKDWKNNNKDKQTYVGDDGK